MRTDLLGRGIAYYMMHDKRLEIELNSGKIVEGHVIEHVNGVEKPWISINNALRIHLEDIKSWREVGPQMNENSAATALRYMKSARGLWKRIDKQEHKPLVNTRNGIKQ